MFNHRLKIIISIVLSFAIVQGISYYTEHPDFASVQAENIKGLLSGIKFDLSAITKSMTLNTGPTEHNYPKGWNETGKNSIDLPSISNYPTATPTPTPLPNVNFPTNPVSRPTSVLSRTPTRIPTAVPTATPKPTKTPKPTPTPALPPINDDTRPGASIDEIFDEVGKRTCFPPALLKAFQQEETGAWFKLNQPASVVKTYNTYGWWIDGSGDPCFGFGYHTQTGIVPSDSVKAGTRCRNAVGSTNDIGIMGIIQISQQEEDVTRKHTIKILPKNIDRRVLFDNALIFAIATRNRVGNPPKDCNNWPDDMIKLAAEKHQGVCVADYKNGNTRNYCTDILNLYKQYK